MGVSGAALATIISQFVGFILLWIGTHRGGTITIRLKNFHPTPRHYLTILNGGTPSLLRQGLGSVATICLTFAARPYGDVAIAGMTIVARIMQFANSCLIGFGQGFQPVCGFNYGAKLYARVREAFWFCVRLSTVVLIGLEMCIRDRMYDVLSDLIFRGEGADQVTGVVGTVAVANQMLQLDASMIPYFVVIISLNLGIINLLPLPALDGGRLVFLIVEAIRRKPVPPEKEGMVHGIGMLLLFGLFIVLTWHDVVTYVL